MKSSWLWVGFSRASAKLKVAIVIGTELSMGWVDPWVGLSWVGSGRDFSVFRGLGWVESTIAKVGAY